MAGDNAGETFAPEMPAGEMPAGENAGEMMLVKCSAAVFNALLIVTNDELSVYARVFEQGITATAQTARTS